MNTRSKFDFVLASGLAVICTICIISIAQIAATGREPPDVLKMIATAIVGALAGALYPGTRTPVNHNGTQTRQPPDP